MQSGRGLGQDEHPRPGPKHGKDKTPLLKNSAGGSKEGERLGKTTGWRVPRANEKAMLEAWMIADRVMIKDTQAEFPVIFF